MSLSMVWNSCIIPRQYKSLINKRMAKHDGRDHSKGHEQRKGGRCELEYSNEEVNLDSHGKRHEWRKGSKWSDTWISPRSPYRQLN